LIYDEGFLVYSVYRFDRTKTIGPILHRHINLFLSLKSINVLHV